MVPVAANPGEGKEPIGLQDLVKTITGKLKLPTRTPDGPFFFSFDHCFQVLEHYPDPA